MDNRFSELTDLVLRESGWFPNRNVPELVLKWKTELQRTDSKEMFTEAEKILLEFGGLRIKEKANIRDSKANLDLNPSLLIGEGDRLEEFEKRLVTSLYPLGEAEGGHLFLAVSQNGKVYLLMMDI